MSNNMQTTAGAFWAYEPTAQPSGPVLVAATGFADSDSAFPIAQLLATQAKAEVKVISVIRPYASAMYAFDLVPVALENEESVRASLKTAVAEQLARTLPDVKGWPLVMPTGDVAREIVAFANAESARVIVTGRGRHNIVDRMFAGETVLRLLQAGETPVLAADASLTHLPRCVVVAIDFSEYSLYAAQVAISQAAPDATVHLVHVGRQYANVIEEGQHGAENDLARARKKLAEWKSELSRGEIEVQDVVLTGTPAKELIRYADEVQADLVALSTHGYGVLRRTMLGSVASSLVRGAGCSVLCVPGSARTVAATLARRAQASDTRVFAREKTDMELAAFSERNLGRPCTVHVYRRDIGAQVLGHDLPLVGATFDTETGTVSIMFGASQLAGHHLAHAVHGVTEVDLSSGAQDRDHVLRLVHDDGYTLVELM
jgi:nucleotide-binding universal stress UspA family protein